jgi:hypothetical protein
MDKGYYNKFIVYRVEDNKKVEEPTFTLLLESDKDSRIIALMYAMFTHNEVLERDLRKLYETFNDNEDF